MAFTLSPLPYEEDALEAVISARTISFHYHKHHKTYVDTLNKLVEGTRYSNDWGFIPCAVLGLALIISITVTLAGQKERP